MSRRNDCKKSFMPLSSDWKEWKTRAMDDKSLLQKVDPNQNHLRENKENVVPISRKMVQITSKPEPPEKFYEFAPNDSERQAMKEVYDDEMALYNKKKKEQIILNELKELCDQQYCEWRRRQIEYMKENPHISINLDYPWDENSIA